MIAENIVGGNPQKPRSASDYYPTPPEVTQALLDFLNLPKHTVVWEPACGKLHMARIMQDNDLDVIATDIQSGTDFLSADLPHGTQWIITNPPFSLADKFIERCAKHEKAFALLLKSQYWHAAKRFELFAKHPPKYVLPLTWRADFLFETCSLHRPLMDVMWCVWYPYQYRTEYFPLQKPLNKN